MIHAERQQESAVLAPEDNKSRFWRQLVEAHWEKQSAAFDRVPESLWRLDEAEVFRLLTWCSEHMNESAVRYYHTRADRTVWELLRPHPEVLPTRADGSLAAFHERMRGDVPSADGYSIFVNNVVRHDHVTWLGVRDFVRELVQCAGLPLHGFNAGIGLGQYDYTPFGVHVDSGRSAFVQPIVGRKRFRIWPGRYIRQHPELIRARGNYSGLEQDSLQLETGAGGLVYWPSDAWHLAEAANGEFNVMLAIGAFVGGKRGDAEPGAVPCDIDNLQKSAEALPDGFVAAAKGSDLCKRGATAEHIWVAYLSGLGLQYPVPPRNDALPQARLQIQQTWPILWRRLPDGQFALGVNGHCVVESGEWIPELIARINSGVPFAVADLVSQSAGGSTVQKLIERFWACRALESATETPQI